jgi:ABC-type maltose transport system permease subunit
MTTLDQAETVAGARVAEAAPGRRPIFSYNWWRYLVSLAAILFALFPVVFVLSAAFNAIPSLTSAQLIPDDVTLENFRRILSGNPGEVGTEQEALDVPYTSWYLNTILISAQRSQREAGYADDIGPT